MLVETPSSNARIITTNSSRGSLFSIRPEQVHQTLSKHILVDGFDMVIDLERSQGSYLYDSRHNKTFLDFFTFFASSPIGLNHPQMLTHEFQQKIFHAAIIKPSNSDAYTQEMADFVSTFARIGIPLYLPHAFFIDGGALAVENALKVAFDWKVRKNYSKGYTVEKGRKIAHFRSAFHGRSGYTMSLTNTDPTKVKYYPQFPDWPRISNPSISFPLSTENLDDVKQREQVALEELRTAFRNNKDDIAAIIIEPIQGEGGDNHFRKEFFLSLREIADEQEALLIFDEVQTGVGLTGKMWAHEYFVRPDILVFGKKMQVCGILAGQRIDEVDENVFTMSGRINSTWGGNLVDMVRSQKYLEIIEEERLIENAATVGSYLLGKLQSTSEEFPTMLSNPRGRGLFAAIDFSTTELRDIARKQAYEKGLIVLGCGPKSLRFRPALNISESQIDEGLEILNSILQGMSTKHYV